MINSDLFTYDLDQHPLPPPVQGPGAQPHRRGRLSVPDRDADAHSKRHGAPSAAVVVTVTNGRLDLGTWERILCQLDS